MVSGAGETMRKRKTFTIICTAVFIILAVFYFIPSGTLKQFLPDAIVKYRIAGPLAALFLSGTFLAPWRITLAMGFSMAGDFMGAYGSFIMQMSFFAMAHVMLIWFFAGKIRKSPSWKTAIAAATLAAFALTCIIPHAPAGIIRSGCAVYATLICTMLCFALEQRNLLFAAGAALFLFSDMILSWNKFVSPVEARKWFIMVPYYTGQLLIWAGAVRENLRKEMRTLQ